MEDPTFYDEWMQAQSPDDPSWKTVSLQTNALVKKAVTEENQDVTERIRWDMVYLVHVQYYLAHKYEWNRGIVSNYAVDGGDFIPIISGPSKYIYACWNHLGDVVENIRRWEAQYRYARAIHVNRSRAFGDQLPLGDCPSYVVNEHNYDMLDVIAPTGTCSHGVQFVDSNRFEYHQNPDSRSMHATHNIHRMSAAWISNTITVTGFQILQVRLPVYAPGQRPQGVNARQNSHTIYGRAYMV